MTDLSNIKEMPLYEIAGVIARDWTNVWFGAVPYLDAMRSLETIEDPYFADSGESIVAYFLSNAAQWKGETARTVKAELRRRLAAA